MPVLCLWSLHAWHEGTPAEAVEVLTLWSYSTMLHTRFVHGQMRQLLSNRSSDLICIGMRPYSFAGHKM